MLFLDPCKLTLKEVESIIINNNLQTKLSELLAEIARMDYNGYIKLSKPRELYTPREWESVLETLQHTILEAKGHNAGEPLPEFIEKKLQKILQKSDFQAFQNFIDIYAAYLPEEIVNDRNNLRFLNWIFSRLKDNTLILCRNQIRLGASTKPEDLVY